MNPKEKPFRQFTFDESVQVSGRVAETISEFQTKIEHFSPSHRFKT